MPDFSDLILFSYKIAHRDETFTISCSQEPQLLPSEPAIGADFGRHSALPANIRRACRHVCRKDPDGRRWVSAEIVRVVIGSVPYFWRNLGLDQSDFRVGVAFFLRILVYSVIHDARWVSLEHFLFSQHPSQTGPASLRLAQSVLRKCV